MNGDRLARHDARSDTAGARKVFGPVRPKIQARLAQLVFEPGITEEIDADALCVRQQQHIVLPRHLPEQLLQPGPSGGDLYLSLNLILTLGCR